MFMDDSGMRTVNRRFLRHDRPTDVIAFTYGEPDCWGEVLISIGQAERQAKDYGVGLAEEIGRLVIHGMLHVMGYDDSDESSRARMKDIENDCLAVWMKSGRLSLDKKSLKGG